MITYLEAIREAQARALAEDPRVYIYGQDVGSFGGAFKATKNLAQEFPGRVLDAPISEDAMIGSAIGAAIEGMRPIIEMQFADFSTVGFNQIVNQAATLYWRTAGPLPASPCAFPPAAPPAAARFTRRAWKRSTPTTRASIVMTPATVEDAYSMLLEAVSIDDPVIFCEHKYLYYHLKAEKLPAEALPTGKARVARAGRDATVVAYSAMVHEALACAEELAARGLGSRGHRSALHQAARYRHRPRLRRAHRPAARRGRSLAVGRRHGRSARPRRERRFRPARCPAHAAERQRHSRPLPSQSLGHASPHRAHHLRPPLRQLLRA